MKCHLMTPYADNEGPVSFVDLDAGWYIMNTKDSANHITIVGPFDSEADVMEYLSDGVELFHTERVIQVTNHRGTLDLTKVALP